MRLLFLALGGLVSFVPVRFDTSLEDCSFEALEIIEEMTYEVLGGFSTYSSLIESSAWFFTVSIVSLASFELLDCREASVITL